MCRLMVSLVKKWKQCWCMPIGNQVCIQNWHTFFHCLQFYAATIAISLSFFVLLTAVSGGSYVLANYMSSTYLQKLDDTGLHLYQPSSVIDSLPHPIPLFSITLLLSMLHASTSLPLAVFGAYPFLIFRLFVTTVLMWRLLLLVALHDTSVVNEK